MFAPIITDVIPKTANVGDIGVSITGTNLNNILVLNIIQNGIYYDITSLVTSTRYSEIRFKAPNFISGRYYLQVQTSTGTSNVF